MNSETQGSGEPPARPPPPCVPGAPPYYDPQGSTYPMALPGEGVPCGAPPPYYPSPGGYQMPPSGYQMPPGGYQMPPGGYQMPPGGYQMPPGGYQMPPQAPPTAPPSLYPDISQLPQPQPVPLGFGTTGGSQPVPDGNLASHEALSPTAPSRVPARPAPPVPSGYSPMAPQQFDPSINHAQPAWWATLRDGEAPPSCVISWKGGNGLKIYFVQKEGHIVSPQKPLEMILFKKIKGKSDVVEESLLGMIEVIGCWRLRLHGKDSYCLHTYNDTYVFLDDSTCPSKSGRIVIIELPADVSKTMRTDLLTFLHEMTDLREEQEGVVDKITTNVGTVYDDITKKLNTAVKDIVPGAHKSTKWLRKGTGNIVRFGGNLVSKGMHLIAEQMPASQPEHQMLEYEESPIHTELMEGLYNFRKCVESGSITNV